MMDGVFDLVDELKLRHGKKKGSRVKHRKFTLSKIDYKAEGRLIHDKRYIDKALGRNN